MRIVEDLVSVQEAANMLSLDRSRIGKLCRQGRFDGARKIGERWVIPRDAVINFKRRPPGAPTNRHKEKELIMQAVNETNKLQEEVSL